MYRLYNSPMTRPPRRNNYGRQQGGTSRSLRNHFRLGRQRYRGAAPDIWDVSGMRWLPTGYLFLVLVHHGAALHVILETPVSRPSSATVAVTDCSPPRAGRDLDCRVACD